MTEPTSTNGPTAARPTAQNLARWRTCLHEAGHASAMRHFANKKVMAVVFDGGYGAAYQDDHKDHISTSEDALVIAAGKAAEILVHTCPLPELSPAPPLDVSYPETATPLLEEIKSECVPDAVKLAQWAIRHVEDRPHRWARNYYLLMDTAESFVREHQKEIVEIATALFGRGIITLPPAVPAKEGKTDVD